MAPGSEGSAPTKEELDEYLLNTPDSRGLKVRAPSPRLHTSLQPKLLSAAPCAVCEIPAAG